MGDDSGEKTEEPTPHKISELRKKGQISKSKDFTSAIMIIVAYIALKAFAVFIFEKMSKIMYYSFEFIGLELTLSLALFLLKDVLITFALCLLPMFGVNVLTAILTEVAQVGPLFSTAMLPPNFSKLNPIEGAKKLFTLKQVVELFKSVIKMSVVIYMIISVIREKFTYVLLAQELSPLQVVQLAGDMMFSMVIKISVIYFIIALLDMLYQKYDFLKQNKMSKKEIKDEYKRLEGDPIIKQRQREAQRQMSQSRQMGSVPDSDVVVTNPVHVAIAIKYTHNKMKAPKVLAKGKRLIAQEIKKLADEHSIPIVENPPLARNLFESTEVGSDVPQMYYKAVAQILAFVYKLKNKRKIR